MRYIVSDKLFLLLVMMFIPYIYIKDKDGKVIFYICGVVFYLLDYIAEAVRATFGGSK